MDVYLFIVMLIYLFMDVYFITRGSVGLIRVSPTPNWGEGTIRGGAGWWDGPREVGQQGGLQEGGWPALPPDWVMGPSGPQCTSKQPVVLVVLVTPIFRLLGFYIYRYHSSMLHVLLWLISCLSACYYYSHSPV